MANVRDMQAVAKALGVSPETVRRGLEQRAYPFGTAVKCGKGYSYQFFPAKVKRYLGIEVGTHETKD